MSVVRVPPTTIAKSRSPLRLPRQSDILLYLVPGTSCPPKTMEGVHQTRTSRRGQLGMSAPAAMLISPTTLKNTSIQERMCIYCLSSPLPSYAQNVGGASERIRNRVHRTSIELWFDLFVECTRLHDAIIMLVNRRTRAVVVNYS